MDPSQLLTINATGFHLVRNDISLILTKILEKSKTIESKDSTSKITRFCCDNGVEWVAILVDNINGWDRIITSKEEMRSKRVIITSRSDKLSCYRIWDGKDTKWTVPLKASLTFSFRRGENMKSVSISFNCTKVYPVFLDITVKVSICRVLHLDFGGVAVQVGSLDHDLTINKYQDIHKFQHNSQK